MLQDNPVSNAKQKILKVDVPKAEEVFIRVLGKLSGGLQLCSKFFTRVANGDSFNQQSLTVYATHLHEKQTIIGRIQRTEDNDQYIKNQIFTINHETQHLPISHTNYSQIPSNFHHKRSFP